MTKNVIYTCSSSLSTRTKGVGYCRSKTGCTPKRCYTGAKRGYERK